LHTASSQSTQQHALACKLKQQVELKSLRPWGAVNDYLCCSYRPLSCGAANNSLPDVAKTVPSSVFEEKQPAKEADEIGQTCRHTAASCWCRFQQVPLRVLATQIHEDPLCAFDRVRWRLSTQLYWSLCLDHYHENDNAQKPVAPLGVSKRLCQSLLYLKRKLCLPVAKRGCQLRVPLLPANPLLVRSYWFLGCTSCWMLAVAALQQRFV